MEHKRALITGITGQDGAYLAEFLLEKGYEVHGIRRRSSGDNTQRLQSLKSRIHLHYGDLTDSGNLFALLNSIKPTELYNLAAQSDVAVSFFSPEYSANVNALGALRLLEAIRVLDLNCRYYQASTSELFGKVQEIPQKETTRFYPRSPYAVSKLYAHWITVNYREAYGLFACNGILFNHESPARAETFVTRKITRTLGRIALGLEKCLFLGNLNSLRDWGHTRDFVEMQWRILQQDEPDDYVIATGEQHSVREFVTLAAKDLGIGIEWTGKGLDERGIISSIDPSYGHFVQKGMEIVKVDPQFFRPSEVETLLGDASKAFRKLGFKPKVKFQDLVTEMMRADYALAKKEQRYETAHLC